MSKPEINWIKNERGKYKSFTDGSEFLIALKVRNNRTKTERWEFDCVKFDCDGDGASLKYRSEECEYYSSWEWDDFEYFCLLDGEMPSVELLEEDG